MEANRIRTSDNRYQAERIFGKKSSSEMAECYGESESTCEETLTGYKIDDALANEAIKWFKSIGEKQE